MIFSMNLRTNFLIALSLLGKSDRMHAGCRWRVPIPEEAKPVPGLSFGVGVAIARTGGQVVHVRVRAAVADLGKWTLGGGVD